MFKRLAASAWLLRTIARHLGDIATSLRAQTVLLARLADHYAPVDPRTTRQEVAADTGVSHLDTDDMVRALAYSARTQRETGHLPDEDEVLIYLADEKTHDLHQRLTAREGELARLKETREW